MIGYSEDYFNWQKQLGFLGGKYDTIKYLKYIKENDKILDFGCGGGFILKELNHRDAFGLEPNPTAMADALSKGLKIVSSLEQLQKDSFDVIFSNHVFEHLECPIEIARELKKYLKIGGLLLVTVPNECSVKYTPNNIDQHLYTWSEINLGNMLYKSGYEVLEVKTIRFRWTPRFTWVHHFFGFNIFKLFCYFNSYLHRDRKEVMAVVRRIS
jgi:SAM-dependent methyltransferase